MLLNEADAQQKTCWKSIGSPSVGKCIGSHCMAWRWVRPEGGPKRVEAIKQYRNDTGSSLKAAIDYVDARLEYLDLPAPTVGFCGLSGRPSA